MKVNSAVTPKMDTQTLKVIKDPTAHPFSLSLSVFLCSDLLQYNITDGHGDVNLQPPPRLSGSVPPRRPRGKSLTLWTACLSMMLRSPVRQSRNHTHGDIKGVEVGPHSLSLALSLALSL